MGIDAARSGVYELIHLALSPNSFSKLEPLCGAQGTGVLCTRETPRTGDPRICHECIIQYDIEVAKEELRRIEYLKMLDARPASVKRREKLERFADFGNRSSDVYATVPVLMLHVSTLGLSSLLLSLAQRAVKFYLKVTK